MKQIVQIAYNPTIAKLINANGAMKGVVSDLLSYTVEGAAFMGAGTWDGRSSFFSHVAGTFPAGFVHMVHSELTRLGHTVRLVKHPLPEALGPYEPIVDEFGNDDPRYDYQMRALRQVEKHGRGIIQVATGGGKSKIAKLIVSRIRRMTLFLTTRGVLMYQMRDDLDACGFKTGVVGDGEWTPKKGVNVGMVQTLIAMLEETTPDAEIRALINKAAKRGENVNRADVREEAQKRFERKEKIRARAIRFLEAVDVVIGEEAHEVGSAGYFIILKHCKNAHYRIALTATPFMRAATEDNMRLMAAFGPVLIKVSEKLLIDRGILAQPHFLFYRPRQHAKLYKSTGWPTARQLGIVENPYRNSNIVNFALKGIKHGLPVLILVQIKSHGQTLRKALHEAGAKVRYVQGDNDQNERKTALKALGSGKIDVVIGTTIFDVGVDVPAVGMVILAAGGKAEVALRQRIGRALRAKKNGPNVAFVIDFDDDVNSHLRDHARQRRAIIEDTPGFAEGILPPGRDFDWSVFGKSVAA